MTHSSGISATNELKSALSQASQGNLRVVKMTITAESLTLDKTVKPSKSWRDDFDSAILPCLKQDQPCYLLYRLDSKHFDNTPEWILFTYVPESTPTRQKMIYASTKMIMKKEVSNLQIKHEISATLTQECSLEGFEQYVGSLNAPKPLTKAEKELEMIKQSEEEMRHQGRKEALRSVSFPLTSELSQALELFKAGKKNYVQMGIDVGKEMITLVSTDRVDVDQLKIVIPTDKPRYNLFLFLLPDRTRQTVFIHSIAVGKSTIKEKMLYSSCKAPFLHQLASQFGITVSRKLETDTPDEITKEYLMEVLASSSGPSPSRNWNDQRQNLPFCR